jgi:hypothetical protein
MRFEYQAYGDQVAKILALDGGGERLMPLAFPKCSSAEARGAIRRAGPRELFPQARAPEAAQAGLYLYFSCFDEAHEVAQSIETPDGSYWHAIVHRQEPDAGNSSYWFRRVGNHAIFTELREEAGRILAARPAAEVRLPGRWDPFWFVDLCEKVQRGDSSEPLQAALEIQRAEWQLLFHYCAVTRTAE